MKDIQIPEYFKSDYDFYEDYRSTTKMKRILLPRCYFYNISERVISSTIHGFCDASKMAYAAVTYLVIRTASSTYVRFLASKTRVAPIDKQTIPRLELLSCLILERLLKDVEEALRLEL